MTSRIMHKIGAVVLSSSLLLTAGSAFANQWSKPHSRTRGAVIGAAAGAVLGPPGMIAGAAIGNGVQAARHSQAKHHTYRTARRHYRHYRRYRSY